MNVFRMLKHHSSQQAVICLALHKWRFANLYKPPENCRRAIPVSRNQIKFKDCVPVLTIVFSPNGAVTDFFTPIGKQINISPAIEMTLIMDELKTALHQKFLPEIGYFRQYAFLHCQGFHTPQAMQTCD